MERNKFCEKCGMAGGEDDLFCQSCGNSLSSVSESFETGIEDLASSQLSVAPKEKGLGNKIFYDGIKGQGVEENGNGKGSVITWDTEISLLTNPLVVKQFIMMLLFSGLFMGLLLAFILLVTGEPEGIPGILMGILIGVSVVGVLLLLSILLVFRGRFKVRFTVDHKGVLWETIDSRAKTGSRLAILVGILARSPQTAGAGTLAMSREKEFVGWKEINSVEYNQSQRMITLRNSWRPVMMLVCTPENYQQIVDIVEGKIDTVEETAADSQRRKSPLPKMLLRTFLVVLASAPVFMLPYPLELDIFIPLLMLLFALATVWLVPFMGYVVIVCALFLAVDILFICLDVRQSIFSSLGMYQVYELFDAGDWFFLFLTFAGLAYLVWFSWRSIRGKILPALFEG
ncbi:MAG: hypothetical protein Q7I94_06450 [Candidatus Contubernalis sp.]|nr:hypothetical protein [Candidatus Contubernalis sp.]